VVSNKFNPINAEVPFTLNHAIRHAQELVRRNVPKERSLLC